MEWGATPKHRVVTSIKIANLKKGRNQTFLIAYDTAPSSKRLDYSGYFKLSRKPVVFLFKTNKDEQAGPTVKCRGLRVAGNFHKDILRYSVPRTCLKKPSKVRVGAETGVVKGRDLHVKDHAPADGNYSHWVKRG